ncbi:unnamed protein product [Brassica oleracea var. botrytis]
MYNTYDIPTLIIIIMGMGFKPYVLVPNPIWINVLHIPCILFENHYNFFL